MLDPKKAAQYKGKISAYDDPIYIADAAVYLKAHQPDLGIDEPVRARREAVQRRGRPAQAAAAERRRVLVRRDQADPGVHERRLTGRHDLAVPVLRPEGRRPAGGDEPGDSGLRARGGRDRLVGHLDDQLPGRASQLHVHVDELHRLAEGPGRRSRSASARRRPTSKACDRDLDGSREADDSGDPKFCDKYHAADPSFWKRVYFWNTPLADCGDGRSDVQGLQRVGPGLDGDQGVTAVAPDAGGGRWKPVTPSAGAEEVGGPQARRPLPRPPAAAGRRRCWPAPIAWLVVGYLGSLAVLLVAGVLERRRAQRRGRTDLHPRQLQDPVRRPRLPRRSPCGRSGSRRW